MEYVFSVPVHISSAFVVSYSFGLHRNLNTVDMGYAVAVKLSMNLYGKVQT